MFRGKSGFWHRIPNSSKNVATMQHSTLSSGPSGSSRSQMLSSSLSGGSDSYSRHTASKLKAPLLPSKLFPLRKLCGAWPEGSVPAWEKGTEGRYPFCAPRRYGGVGAEALPLESMRYKHDSEDNEDEDMNLLKITVYKK